MPPAVPAPPALPVPTAPQHQPHFGLQLAEKNKVVGPWFPAPLAVPGPGHGTVVRDGGRRGRGAADEVEFGAPGSWAELVGEVLGRVGVEAVCFVEIGGAGGAEGDVQRWIAG